MKLNFSNGIEILIDDENLLSWQQIGNKIIIVMKNGEKFEMDSIQKTFTNIYNNT